MEHSWIENDFVNAVLGELRVPKKIVWAGDYADNEEGIEENLFGLIEEKIKPPVLSKLRYLVNHSKKEYVDLGDLPKDSDDWIIHPLPLLTCEGNGRGGGDFRDENDFVGVWARDLIQNSNENFSYAEIKPNFIET
jgi:hypothetical protein